MKVKTSKDYGWVQMFGIGQKPKKLKKAWKRKIKKQTVMM